MNESCHTWHESHACDTDSFIQLQRVAAVCCSSVLQKCVA